MHNCNADVAPTLGRKCGSVKGGTAVNRQGGLRHATPTIADPRCATADMQHPRARTLHAGLVAHDDVQALSEHRDDGAQAVQVEPVLYNQGREGGRRLDKQSSREWRE